MTDNRTRIQNYLHLLCSNFSFPKVVYHPETKLASLSETPSKTPDVFVNEVSGRYSIDRNQGRIEALKADGWTFSVIVQFKEEVSVDAFIRSLMIPQHLEKDDDSPRVRIYLSSTNMKHPPRSQSANGSTLSLVFNAIPARI